MSWFRLIKVSCVIYFIFLLGFIIRLIYYISEVEKDFRMILLEYVFRRDNV